PGVEANALAELRNRLRSAHFSGTAINDARAAVRDLAWEAERLTGLNPTVAVLEFACGASNALDEYTVFLTPGQPLDDPAALSGALLRLRSEGMRALIIDLRGNPGGLFAAAVQVADRFLPAGVIVSTQGQLRPYSKTYMAQNPMTALDVPLVVLVDGDTASAA